MFFISKEQTEGTKQMNVAKDLIARIEAYRATNAKPCKSYKTEAKAEEVAEELAVSFANYFSRFDTTDIRPCRYIVVFNEAWGRWVVGFDFTELLARQSSTGGYIGVAGDKGFFTY
jgi:hypothetical protein